MKIRVDFLMAETPAERSGLSHCPNMNEPEGYNQGLGRDTISN